MVHVMESLSLLLRGSATDVDRLGKVMFHLMDNLDRTLQQASALDEEADVERLSLFGPFLGRSILEISLTAILGRIDPFRILIVRETQLNNYNIGEKNEAAIQWSGDILANKRVDKLWAANRSSEKMTRALLGDYQDHVLWRPAFDRLLDAVPENRGGEWMRQLRQLTSDRFISVIRQAVSETYKACSKGVHHEFVVPQAQSFDKYDIKTLIQNAIESTAKLAFTLNMSSQAVFGLSVEKAIDFFETAQANEEI